MKTVFPDASTRAAQIARIKEQNISPQVINEFSSLMSKHVLTVPMVRISSNREGGVYVSVFSQNRNSMTSIIAEEFDRGMRERLYRYDRTSGDYTLNEEAFEEAIAYLLLCNSI